jgi:hypothetical protein
MELHTDLELLFGSDLGIIRELMHRFDELPIHSIVYYQSYNQGGATDPCCYNKHEIGAKSDTAQ